MKEFKFGQWTLEVDEAAGAYKIFNPGEDGKRKFYAVEQGKYGQPLIYADPDHAFDAPPNLTYVNAAGEKAQPTEKIAGIVCKDGPRFSLTNAASKGISVVQNNDGSIMIDGAVWYLVTLFQKDKNRVIGYDAYFSKEKPEHVRIMELGDLDLY